MDTKTKIVLLVCTMLQFIMAFNAQFPATAVPGGIDIDESCNCQALTSVEPLLASVPFCLWDRYGGCGEFLSVTCKDGLGQCAYKNAYVFVQMVSYYEGIDCEDTLTMSDKAFEKIADESADEINIKIRY